MHVVYYTVAEMHIFLSSRLASQSRVPKAISRLTTISRLSQWMAWQVDQSIICSCSDSIGG